MWSDWSLSISIYHSVREHCELLLLPAPEMVSDCKVGPQTSQEVKFYPLNKSFLIQFTGPQRSVRKDTKRYEGKEGHKGATTSPSGLQQLVTFWSLTASLREFYLLVWKAYNSHLWHIPPLQWSKTLVRLFRNNQGWVFDENNWNVCVAECWKEWLILAFQLLY